MEEEIIACLLDVAGVQSYIFSSNKLKENLGASFLVKNIYTDNLSPVVKDSFDLKEFEINFWKTPPKTNNNLFSRYEKIDICYIGGGNALLLFKTLEDYKNFIKEFTIRLLIHAPGVHIDTAYIVTSQADIEHSFGKIRKLLREQLEFNKRIYLPNIHLPRHGFTASCPRTGLSSEILVKQGEFEALSSVCATKINYAQSPAFDNEFKTLLAKIHLKLNLPPSKRALKFTDDIEKLGQQEGDNNFISVVHIDGNDVGALFEKQFKNKSFIPARHLSIDLSQKTEDSFTDLLEVIIKDEKECLISEKNFQENTLPIRPIIIGGDDITFVCPGKLGIYFAEKFLEIFKNQTSTLPTGSISACAGIAIAKTKYPFFRAYKIAEALCDNAKKMRIQTKDQGAWLDFHVIEAAKTGDLDQIRENYYQTPSGKLYMKPYPLKNSNRSLLKKVSFMSIKKMAWNLKNLPKNKRMDIAQVLFENENEQDKFINHMEFRRYSLPLPDAAVKSFFQTAINSVEGAYSKETYFLDLLELIEFYPNDHLKTYQAQTKEDSEEVHHEIDT